MKKYTIDHIKGYFIDPRNAESAKSLAEMTSTATIFMAQVYASGNRTLKEGKEKSRIADKNLNNIFKRILQKEALTRKFDHKFMGHVHPHGNKIGILAQFIASFMNTNTVVAEVSTQENLMETEVLQKMATWFDYDISKYSGNIVSGGSISNLTALLVAREKILSSLKKDEVKKLYILVNKMRHYSIIKAANILGINVEIIELPLQGFKTDIIATERIINDLIVRDEGKIMALIGIAGETETGEIDDLKGLANLSEKYSLYFHVDAAYGGPYILSRVKDKFFGIEDADSITIDPHKLLYVPYEAGAILFKSKVDHHLISSTMTKEARYLLQKNQKEDTLEEVRNYGTTRVEGSLGSGGVIATWATLELLGDEGMATILNYTLDLTKHACEMVSESNNLRVLHKPDINTVLISLKNKELDIKTHNMQINAMYAEADSQGYYISRNGEIDNGKNALRFVAMNPHTTKEDISNLISILDHVIN
jgi:L-2,4-diaminobutyrate decarboxylase